ncbi:MAG: hypothetical protein NXI30_02560 [bacterium]|nr:hypothetical protein [bacterium]
MLPAVLALVLLEGTPVAAAPDRVAVQGQLLDDLGEPIEGAVDLQVLIWDQPTGGTLYYQESFSGLVTDASGVFNLVLGTGVLQTPDGIGTAVELAGDTAHIQLQIEGELLEPRQPLGSVPFAFNSLSAENAENLGGLSSTDIQSQIDLASSDVSTLSDRVDTDIATLQGVDQSLQSGVDANSSSISFLGSQIPFNLTNRLAGAEAQLFGVQTDLGTAQSDIAGLQSTVAGLPQLSAENNWTGITNGFDNIQARSITITTGPSTSRIGIAFGNITNVNYIFSNSMEAGSMTVANQMSAASVRIRGGADIAEPFDFDDAQAIVPGMVVAIDPDSPGRLRLSTEPYDSKVAGIISGAGGVQPGLTLSQEGSIADGDHPVALTGRVYTWVDADENGPVRPGDMLTTSSRPGHAMRASEPTKSFGAVIGKAMGRLDEGQGLVLTLVNLQ